MKTRCWPGCEAIITKSYAGNEGKVVRCLTLTEVLWAKTGVQPTWVIDRPLVGWRGDVSPMIADCQLTPLTPPPGSVTESEVTTLFKPKEIA